MALLGDITWFRGDSFPIELTIKDKETKEPVDITGYGFLMTVNTVDNPVDISTQLFQVVGVVDPDQVTNKGKLTFTPSVADGNQTPETYYYDVQMTDPAGNIRTIAKYNFKITQDITKV